MKLIWILCKGFSHEWIRSTMAWMIQNMGASNWLGDLYLILTPTGLLRGALALPSPAI
ncbi:hypothetical protein [Leptospira vanthielii]|uniref:hypothetical protein n=1 Tax=Leptospira vanthielii TaxID=293085 RepID=UPI00143D0164|nr:hypothetical protein [Leptospira vanthielii]